MHSSTETLCEILTKIRHEDICRQKKNNDQSVAMIIFINRFRRSQIPANQQRYRLDKLRNSDSIKRHSKNEIQTHYGNNSLHNGSFRFINRYCKKEGKNHDSPQAIKYTI